MHRRCTPRCLGRRLPQPSACITDVAGRNEPRGAARRCSISRWKATPQSQPVQLAVVAYVPRRHKEGARAPPGPDGRTEKQRMLAGVPGTACFCVRAQL